MTKTNSEEIIIVYATNDMYAPYMGVSIYSLIQNTSREYFYKIYILQESLEEYHKERILKLARENVIIEFFDVYEHMKDMEIPKVNHLTKETTYRLLSDKLFFDYKKVLYIDCDTIINRDIAELYNSDIENYIVGAARGNIHVGFVEYIQEDLKVSVKKYFNAGILLINIPMFHKYDIGSKCFRLLQQRIYRTMDQDVLNITCQGLIKFIDEKWNVEWGHITGRGNEDWETYFADQETEERFYKKNKEPYIIHYTTPIKPWAYPHLPMAEYFWRYAEKTDFYWEILFANITACVPKTPQSPFVRFIFPWEAIKPSGQVLLYGAGVVGRTFLEQIKQCRYCNVVAICDRNYSAITDLDVPVISIEQIGEYEYDAIIVAIEKEEVAEIIIQDLQSNGIPKEKIFWRDYIRK